LYAGTFDDQAKGKELALSAIDQGADVVFAAAGLTGVGSITACQERGALFIGVDADQYETVPGSGDVMLTSAIKRVDTAVFETIKAVVEGTFVGAENREFGLAEDGVGLAPFHDFEDAVSQDIKDAVEEARQAVLDGSVTVPAMRTEL
jgi:basic membrane protein A and related proteins